MQVLVVPPTVNGGSDWALDGKTGFWSTYRNYHLAFSVDHLFNSTLKPIQAEFSLPPYYYLVLGKEGEFKNSIQYQSYFIVFQTEAFGFTFQNALTFQEQWILLACVHHDGLLSAGFGLNKFKELPLSFTMLYSFAVVSKPGALTTNKFEIGISYGYHKKD